MLILVVSVAVFAAATMPIGHLPRRRKSMSAPIDVLSFLTGYTDANAAVIAAQNAAASKADELKVALADVGPVYTNDSDGGVTVWELDGTDTRGFRQFRPTIATPAPAPEPDA